MLSSKNKKKGESLFTEKDIDSMIRSLEKQADLIESKARGHERYANQLLSELGKLKVRDLKW